LVVAVGDGQMQRRALAVGDVVHVGTMVEQSADRLQVIDR
jgi:hypothetical protein